MESTPNSDLVVLTIQENNQPISCSKCHSLFISEHFLAVHLEECGTNKEQKDKNNSKPDKFNCDKRRIAEVLV